MADKIVTLNTPGPAQYGQTTNYGAYGSGSVGARNEAWDQGNHNNAAQGAIAGAAGYANGAAQNGTGFAAGEQDAGAANDQASGANGNQAGAIELARRMAEGKTPGASTIQLQRGLNQASAQQTAMAGGARGSAALATAGANARANTGNLQQNAFTGAGMLRSQDMATGRGLYASLTNDQRGQDAQALGEANRVSQANQKAQDDYQLGMGNAAVGFGQVANGQNQNDLQNFNRGMAPVYGQDDMNQQGQEWLYEDRQHRATDNQGNT